MNENDIQFISNLKEYATLALATLLLMGYIALYNVSKIEEVQCTQYTNITKNENIGTCK